MSDELSRRTAEDTDESVEGIDRLHGTDPESTEDDFEGHRLTERLTERTTERLTERTTE